MYRIILTPAANKNNRKKSLTSPKFMLFNGKISIKRKKIQRAVYIGNMNDERSRGKPKINKASKKDDPAGTFPDVEGFQKSVEPD